MTLSEVSSSYEVRCDLIFTSHHLPPPSPPHLPQIHLTSQSSVVPRLVRGTKEEEARCDLIFTSHHPPPPPHLPPIHQTSQSAVGPRLVRGSWGEVARFPTRILRSPSPRWIRRRNGSRFLGLRKSFQRSGSPTSRGQLNLCGRFHLWV